MNVVYPDYQNCGLNVVSSVMQYFGATCSHTPHPVVEELLKKKYQKVVLMLFDGMGMDVLRHFLPEDSFLRTHIGTEMTAVYPSTTTNATSSIECGLSPKEHAWLGWTLYFKEIDKPVDVFINKSDGEPAADYDVAWRYIPKTFVFDKLNAVDGVEACSVSNFSEEYYAETIDDVFSITSELCKGDKKRYIYTYWNEPDHTMHGDGCYAENIGEIVRDIDRRVEKLAAELGEDTLILITADHGLIDAVHHYLDDHPRIVEMIEHVPTIEARAASFHVKPEYLQDFPRVFREEYGENFLLLGRDEFIERFLGDGEEHPKVRDFVGDYMALATGPDCIDKWRSDFELKGVHAGLTEQEMLVPLIVVNK